MSPTHICNVKFLGEKAYISMLHTKKSSQITPTLSLSRDHTKHVWDDYSFGR